MGERAREIKGGKVIQKIGAVSGMTHAFSWNTILTQEDGERD